jgi:hypothetical protein
MESIQTTILQHPQDLRLAVLQDDNLSGLTILQKAEVRCGAWAFVFAIIGESHFVRVTHGGQFIMQEVLACVELPENVRGHTHALDTLARHQYHAERYAVGIDFAYQEMHAPTDYDGMLEYAFPETYGVTPITRICWWQEVDRLRWQTLHTYPALDHITYVFSDSHFDIHPEE